MNYRATIDPGVQDRASVMSDLIRTRVELEQAVRQAARACVTREGLRTLLMAAGLDGAVVMDVQGEVVVMWPLMTAVAGGASGRAGRSTPARPPPSAGGRGRVMGR